MNRVSAVTIPTGHRNRKSIRICGIILATIYASALFADFISPYTATWTDKTKSFHPPSEIHLFYTDSDNRISFRPYCQEMEVIDVAFKRYRAVPEYTLRAISSGSFPETEEIRIVASSENAEIRKRQIVEGLGQRLGFDADSIAASTIASCIDGLEKSKLDDDSVKIKIDIHAGTREPILRDIMLVKGNKNFIGFFNDGVAYRLFGLFNSTRHLFGSDTGGYYPFGADQLGRDTCSRVFHGGRISLTIGLLGVLLAFSAAMIAGSIAGYYGGFIDSLIMRVCETIAAFPMLLVLIALRAALPRDTGSLPAFVLILCVISLFDSAYIARIIRGIVLSTKNEEHVIAAKAMGVPDSRILVHHILKNSATFIYAKVATSIPGYMLAESALSFLGLGITEPDASWGLMLSSCGSLAAITRFPWLLIPGLFICITITAWHLSSDMLSDKKARKLNAEAAGKEKKDSI